MFTVSPGERAAGLADRFDLELGSLSGRIAILPGSLRAVLLLLVEVVPDRAAGQPSEETADQRTPFPPDEPPDDGAPQDAGSGSDGRLRVVADGLVHAGAARKDCRKEGQSDAEAQELPHREPPCNQ